MYIHKKNLKRKKYVIRLEGGNNYHVYRLTEYCKKGLYFQKQATNLIPSKSNSILHFFTELKKTILHFVWKPERPSRAKAILSRKTNASGTTMLDLEINL